MQSEPNAHDPQAFEDERLLALLEADDPRAALAASAFADDPRAREALERALAVIERMDAAGADLRSDRRLAAALDDQDVVGAGLVGGTLAELQRRDRAGRRLWRGSAALAAASVAVFLLARTALRDPEAPGSAPAEEVLLGADDAPTLHVTMEGGLPVFSWDEVAPPGGWYDLRGHAAEDEGLSPEETLLWSVDGLEQRTWRPEATIVDAWPDSFVWTLDVRDAAGGLRASVSRTCSLP